MDKLADGQCLMLETRIVVHVRRADAAVWALLRHSDETVSLPPCRTALGTHLSTKFGGAGRQLTSGWA